MDFKHVIAKLTDTNYASQGAGLISNTRQIFGEGPFQLAIQVRRYRSATVQGENFNG